MIIYLLCLFLMSFTMCHYSFYFLYIVTIFILFFFRFATIYHQEGSPFTQQSITLIDSSLYTETFVNRAFSQLELRHCSWLQKMRSFLTLDGIYRVKQKSFFFLIFVCQNFLRMYHSLCDVHQGEYLGLWFLSFGVHFSMVHYCF